MYNPTKNQLKYLDWEMGAFLHFGIRTFNHGHRDWDGKVMLASSFNPKQLDCEQWMKEIKNFGFKYAIMTTKHHDGFALWPSEYTDFSVKTSPWKDGQGDVVKEFTDACRKYDIAVGLYYSPAQWGNTIEFKEGKEYDDYFINQISELLTNYGKIDYLWFDGCGSGGHTYDAKRIISVIRSLQPDIMIFGMWDPDTSWVGNEDGYAPYPHYYEKETAVFGENELKFMPLECDCRIRDSWFYDLNADTVKTTDELIGMYEMSVGRGANFLLNIGPDDHGLICKEDADALHLLKSEIIRLYGKPLLLDLKRNVSDNVITYEYSEDYYYSNIKDTVNIPLVRSAILEEDITESQNVNKFRLYAHIPTRPGYADIKYCVFDGATIGRKLIVRFPAIRAPKFTIEILDTSGTPKIASVKFYE